MNELNILNKEVEMMSTLEIAKLTGKNHNNTTRLVKSLIDKELILTDQFDQSDYTNERGKTYQMYMLDKTASILVVAQQSPEFKEKMIERWQELESQQTLLPDFNDPVASASAWADQVELVQERDLELSHAAPKVAVYKSLAERERDVKTTVLANRLEISPCQLEQFMVDQGIKLKYHDLPAAGYSDWFNLVERCDDDVEYIQALITPLGTIEITKLFNAHHQPAEVNQ